MTAQGYIEEGEEEYDARVGRWLCPVSAMVQLFWTK